MSAGGGGLPTGRDGPHVFVADVEHPELADDDRHHLARVLRLRPGDPLTVCDGEGRWRVCRMGPAVEPAGDVVVVPEPSRPLTVAAALVKGERPELVVQKLTELGIDRVALFAAERSVVRWDERRAARQLDRLRRVSREAAMQSRRVRVPSVELLDGFAAAATLDGAVMADRSGALVDRTVSTVLVGPEGGWSETERAVGLPTLRLADGVLRAETAAIAAGVLLSAQRAGIVAAG